MLNWFKNQYTEIRNALYELLGWLEEPNPPRITTGNITYDDKGFENNRKLASFAYDDDGYGYHPLVSGVNNEELVIFRTTNPNDTSGFTFLQRFNYGKKSSRILFLSIV